MKIKVVLGIKVVLDTNILIDFLLIQLKEERNEDIHPGLRKSKEIFDLLQNEAFFNLASQWNEFEFRDMVMKLILERKFIESGYALPEFGVAKQYIELNDEEMNAVDDAVSTMKKYSVYSKINFELDEIENLNKKGISVLDCILFLQAEKNSDCNYFVTKDNRLRKKVGELALSRKVINRKTFLSKMKKSNN